MGDLYAVDVYPSTGIIITVCRVIFILLDMVVRAIVVDEGVMGTGKRQATLIDMTFSVVFGPYGPLVRHCFYSTTTFLFILFCFFVVKTATEHMFPPNEYATIALRLVDTYAGALGLIGYIVWTSMDITFLLKKRLGPGSKRS